MIWIKALHVIADIAWMAGMLYLPRLFVYHADAIAGSRQSETFKVMERRLLRYIMTPAMIVAWMTGLLLAYDAGFFRDGWFQAKFLLVIGMSGLHEFFSVVVRRFSRDQNQATAKYYRIMNEAPTLLMVLIVILVIVKPF